MDGNAATSDDERRQELEELLDRAQEAYALCQHLRGQTRRVRRWDLTGRGQLAYSLGICWEDANVAAVNLGGLCHELRRSLSLLDRPATQ